MPEHPKFFLLVSIYIFVGLSFISMVVNLLMDAMAEKLDEAQEKLRELAKTKKEEEEAGVRAPVRRPPPPRVDKVDFSCLPACTRAET